VFLVLLQSSVHIGEHCRHCAGAKVGGVSTSALPVHSRILAHCVMWVMSMMMICFARPSGLRTSLRSAIAMGNAAGILG